MLVAQALTMQGSNWGHRADRSDVCHDVLPLGALRRHPATGSLQRPGLTMPALGLSVLPLGRGQGGGRGW